MITSNIVKYILLTIVCCLVFLSTGLSQTRNEQPEVIKGTVYEDNKSQSLPGASVILLNENERIIGGTVTNIEGKFTIKVQPGTTKISISFVGLKTQVLPLDTRDEYEVILLSDNVLDEVKVLSVMQKTDMGMMQKNLRDIANAVSSVDMKTIERQTHSTLDQLLQGSAPGMEVNFTSGDPGAGASIRIRGVSSLQGDNSPLWIIDGVEMIGEDYNIADIENFGSSSNPIAGLDPNDIESIDILKDASSTAIYGSRGANGVIVIRTKRGYPGKPQFTLKARASLKWDNRDIPLLNGDQQRMFVIEARANAVGYDNPNTLVQLRGDLTRDDAWLFNNNINTLDMITRTGIQQNYSFSLRGGGERLTYYWSLGYDVEYGTTKGGGFNRFSTMMKLDYTMSSRLKISSKFTYSNTLRDMRSAQWPIKGFNRLSDTYLSPRILARNRAAFLSIYNENGTEYYIKDAGAGGSAVESPSIGTYMYNPIAMIDNATYQQTMNSFTASLQLDLTVNKMLSLKSLVSIDYQQTGDEFFAPSEALGVFAHHSSFNNGRRNDRYTMQLNNNSSITFCPFSNELHHLQFIAISNIRYRTTESTSLQYNRSASSELKESSGAAMIGGGGGTTKTDSEVGFVLDAHYRFLNRYGLNVSLKTEGSSKFGKDNPFSIYPTIGLVWNMDEEAFLKDREWIGMIKPRFSYGVSGKMPNIDAMLSVTYSTGSSGYLGETYTNIKKFSNDVIREERTYEYNWGLDWNILGARLSGEFNYYIRKTKDLLVNTNISTSTGWSSQMVNFGELENKGWEFAVTVVPVQKEQLRWRLTFNIAHNDNKMLSMPQNIIDAGGYTQTYGYGGFRSKLTPGSMIGMIYGYRANGVYAHDKDAVVRDFNDNIVYESDGTPKILQYGQNGPYFKGGDMIYEDVNHDGLIDELDVVQIGRSVVDYYGGINTTLTWRQWSLSLAFYYSLGLDAINGSRYYLENMSGENNQARSVLRRWRRQGDVTDMPRAEDDCLRNYAASTRWVEDASYLRLKNLQLNYELNRTICQRLGLKTASFSATCTNLFTWSKYKGVDPEIPRGSGVIPLYIDNQTTPTSSPQLTLGIGITF